MDGPGVGGADGSRGAPTRALIKKESMPLCDEERGEGFVGDEAAGRIDPEGRPPAVSRTADAEVMGPLGRMAIGGNREAGDRGGGTTG